MLIVFSGLDGAGKSTQIELLTKQMRAAGHRPRYLWSRGGYTPLFNALKSLLRRVSGGRTVPPSGPSAARRQAFANSRIRRLWLRLAMLDLIWLYGVQLRWWLWRGKAIICDRYLGDTLIDFQLNFPQEQVEQWVLWRLLQRLTPSPNAAFLLLIPVEESVRRSNFKGEPFPDSPEVLAERMALYRALAQAGHWQVLDGRQTIEELAQQVRLTIGPSSPIPAASTS